MNAGRNLQEYRIPLPAPVYLFGHEHIALYRYRRSRLFKRVQGIPPAKYIVVESDIATFEAYDVDQFCGMRLKVGSLSFFRPPSFYSADHEIVGKSPSFRPIEQSNIR